MRFVGFTQPAGDLTNDNPFRQVETEAADRTPAE